MFSSYSLRSLALACGAAFSPAAFVPVSFAQVPAGVSSMGGSRPATVEEAGRGSRGADGLGSGPGADGGLPTGASPAGQAIPGAPGTPGSLGRAGTLPTGAVGSNLQGQNLRADATPLPALAFTQFQRFVQESTGNALPLYGYSLFERPRFPSLADAPVPATYVVGPGDELDIKIWGGVDVALRLPVDRSGQITVPRVGPITVAGVKAGELDAFLKRQVGKVYANFELSATVGKLRTIQVYVVGQARAPGAYTVSSLSNLVSAVFESGGPSATGSMRRIELVRAGQKVATLDLYQFIQAGSMGAGTGAEGGDQRLLPGDVIVVPPAGPRVALTGALDNPGIFELATPEEPIAKVLGYSGSSTLLATPHKVLVERVNNQKASAPREVEERTLDAQGQRTTLRDGDLVTLLKIKPQFANAVTLRGNVAQPLRYAFKPGMRIADLIPEPEALIVDDYYTRKNILVQYDTARRSVVDPQTGQVRPLSADGQRGAEETGRRVSVDELSSSARSSLAEVNWDYASIERLKKGDNVTTLLSFNLGRAVRQKDPDHNLVLEPGDVVTIYGVNDIPVPQEKRFRFVKIGGEVKAPGVYQIKPGETLTDLVVRAGGLATGAYPYGTTFTRESTRAQQQANLEQAVRRIEAQLSTQASGALQASRDAESAQQAQAQLAAQRMTVERLKALRASGRISLEMDPAGRGDLPSIALEDGDVINVPPRPSFVSVFGSVLAESAFIHRPGLTVRDYLDRAGPTREADLDAALLIRADGSVMANGAQRSWLGAGSGSFMSTRVYPGDTVFLPEVVDKRTPYVQFIQGLKDWTQLFYQFGLGAAAVRTLRN